MNLQFFLDQLNGSQNNAARPGAKPTPPAPGIPFGPNAKLPPVTSPEYLQMVQAGLIEPPQQGTMEFLDFAQRNPGVLESLAKKKKKPAQAAPAAQRDPGMALIDILEGTSPLQQGY